MADYRVEQLMCHNFLHKSPTNEFIGNNLWRLAITNEDDHPSASLVPLLLFHLGMDDGPYHFMHHRRNLSSISAPFLLLAACARTGTNGQTFPPMHHLLFLVVAASWTGRERRRRWPPFREPREIYRTSWDYNLLEIDYYYHQILLISSF